MPLLQRMMTFVSAGQHPLPHIVTSCVGFFFWERKEGLLSTRGIFHFFAVVVNQINKYLISNLQTRHHSRSRICSAVHFMLLGFFSPSFLLPAAKGKDGAKNGGKRRRAPRLGREIWIKEGATGDGERIGSQNNRSIDSSAPPLKANLNPI